MDIIKIKLSENKMKEIFPRKNNVDYSKLQLSNVGLYSVSKVDGAKQLSYLLKKYFKTTNITITDGTANNGSDSIYLSFVFKNINAIEKNKIEYDILKNNIECYNITNIKSYNDSTLNLLSTLKQDVIYIDAPFEGPDYKKHKSLKLYLDNKELSDIYNDYKKYCSLFVFKVPTNYDVNNFLLLSRVTQLYIHSYNKNNVIKYYFLFVPVRK